MNNNSEYPIFHTPADTEALTAAGLPLDSTQPREGFPVPCQNLGCRVRTHNVMGGCDTHYIPPAVISRLTRT